ncbi:fucolectin-6-like [Mercenaria mercenaria]|uniref:fucolectin-6-like n=1 Tax=Mercenaria mercenaria TaxID=6596 RepID=UPI00234F619F|nr:fucolectin-6-like [Mercenaria mercenaria]
MAVSTVLLVIIGATTTTYAGLDNVAQGKPAEMSSIYDNRWPASKAVDGIINSNMAGGSCFHTDNFWFNWWKVDLLQIYQVKQIELYNRQDCCADRAKNIDLSVGPSSTDMEQVKTWAQLSSFEKLVFETTKSVRYVRIMNLSEDYEDIYFHLCEVKVLVEV